MISRTASSSTKCNFIEFHGNKIVYKRYASLYFAFCVDSTDNELILLEIIHRYVEALDRYFGNVCELDIIFNFEKAHWLLDELIIKVDTGNDTPAMSTLLFWPKFLWSRGHRLLVEVFWGLPRLRCQLCLQSEES